MVFIDMLVGCFVNFIHVKASALVKARAVYVYYWLVCVQNARLLLSFRAEG